MGLAIRGINHRSPQKTLWRRNIACFHPNWSPINSMHLGYRKILCAARVLKATMQLQTQASQLVEAIGQVKSPICLAFGLWTRVEHPLHTFCYCVLLRWPRWKLMSQTVTSSQLSSQSTFSKAKHHRFAYPQPLLFGWLFHPKAFEWKFGTSTYYAYFSKLWVLSQRWAHI